jgi:hypothetical protein
MTKYSYAHCEYGELFGLAYSDLTDEQLNKISTDKMIELLPLDPRAQILLSVRMLKDIEGKEVEAYEHLDKEDWNTYTSLRAAYNELLVATNSFDEKFNDSYSYRYCRRDKYVFWIALDDKLKLREVERFMMDQASVVNAENVDYTWICSYQPELSRKVMRYVVAHECGYRKNATVNIIIKADADMLKEMEPSISTLRNEYRLQMLRNPNTPEEWLDGLLRIYAKRNPYSVPEVCRPLSHTVLAKLPPITRLEVMENLVHKGNKFSLQQALPDVKNGEDFRGLLFGALTRHSDRVITLIKDYNFKMGLNKIDASNSDF